MAKRRIFWRNLSIAGACAVLVTACRSHPQPEIPPADTSKAAAGESAGQNLSSENEDHASFPTTLGAVIDADGSTFVDLSERLAESLANWRRIDSVQSALAGGIADIHAGWDEPRLRHFHVESAAACRYRLKSASSEVAREAQVLLVEARSADDAVGLESCRAGSVWSQPTVSRSPGVSNNTTNEHFAVRGRSYLYVMTEAGAGESVPEIDELAERILAGVPAGARIRMIDCLPGRADDSMESDEIGSMRRWSVRDLASLPGDTAVVPAGMDVRALGRILRLNERTLMCIGSYAQPQSVRPNTVWFVAYPSASMATQAYERYSAHLSATRTGAWQSTSLMRPSSRFLIGTWTIEEESLQYVMPQVAASLAALPSGTMTALSEGFD